MFIIIVLFTIVQLVITLQFILMIGGVINNLGPLKMRYWGFRLLGYPPVAFGVNMIISLIMSFFTDAGLTAGFANLTSGVIAMLLNRFVLEIKFGVSEINREYISRITEKKQKSIIRKVLKSLFPSLSSIRD
jgi:hypothetical protein